MLRFTVSSFRVRNEEYLWKRLFGISLFQSLHHGHHVGLRFKSTTTVEWFSCLIGNNACAADVVKLGKKLGHEFLANAFALLVSMDEEPRQGDVRPLGRCARKTDKL